jgi:hypothetical protein
MQAVDPESVTLAFRDHIIAIAREVLPGKGGVCSEGFAGRMLSDQGRQATAGKQRFIRLSEGP